MLKTRTRTIVTLAIGPFVARETLWWHPRTDAIAPAPALRRLVAPGCNYGYDVVVYVGHKLFLDAQPVRHIMAQLDAQHIHLSASTVTELGRRFIVLLALAHRRSAARLKEAMALRGGYLLHLDATYEDKSPLLMTGIDAVLEIILGNIKLPSEKADGIVPFLRQIKDAFGPPLALVHDLSKGILSAVQQVFPGLPDYVCHFHFLRDLGKDLFGAAYDTLRQRLQRHGTAGQLRARLRTWQKQIDAQPAFKQTLSQLPPDGPAMESLALPPLLAAFLLAHWILEGLQQGQGYGFPFDRPYLALARRAQAVHEQLKFLKTLPPGQPWRENLPFHHLDLDLHDLVGDRPLGHTLEQMEIHLQPFEQLRQILRLAPAHETQGLNHAGQPVEMKALQQQVQRWVAQIRARPDFATTPAFQKMIAQIEHYGPKLFAAPLVVTTAQGPLTIQPQRTNNIMERFFRDLKRDCRRKTGANALGRTLRTMLADTPLVKNLQNPEYRKILLDGQPNLEALFAQIEPLTVRRELQQAQQNPEKTSRAIKHFIASLPSPIPIKNFVVNFRSNRIS